jgi:hypothetical protein
VRSSLRTQARFSRQLCDLEPLHDTLDELRVPCATTRRFHLVRLSS